MQAFYYDTIDSTNEEAKRLVHAGKITGKAYVVSNEQSNGKGRMGHKWISPKGAGIYLSVVEINVGLAAKDSTLFTLAAGVACVEAVRDVTGLTVALKPINDLYVEGAKLGGILTETFVEGGSLEALITGIGINVLPAERVLPADSPPICCLEEVRPREHKGRQDLSVQDLIQRVVTNVFRWNAIAIAADGDKVRRAWARYSVSQTNSTPG